MRYHIINDQYLNLIYFEQVWSLAVEEGQRINITFLYFDIEDEELCQWDWVELISDKYNFRHCGQTTKPWSIIIDTNSVTLRFSSDFIYVHTGFLAIWSPTTAPPMYPSSTGCGQCNFPFVLNDRIFDTCTSIDGDQPWCQASIPAHVDQGNHLINVKSYCPDTDSTCPRTPQMSTHINNQPGKCCKFHKLSSNLHLQIMFRLWNTKQRRG